MSLHRSLARMLLLAVALAVLLVGWLLCEPAMFAEVCEAPTDTECER